MRYIIIAIILINSSLNVNAQSAYENVCKACKLAVSAFQDGGSPSELEYASKILKENNPQTLYIVPTNNFKENEIVLDKLNGKRLLFSAKYFDDILRAHKVYKTAKEYEEGSRGRGGNVYLTTKGVKAKKKICYKMEFWGNKTLSISAIAETKRNIYLALRYKDNRTGKIITKKENYKETEGYYEQEVRNIILPNKQKNIIEIEIENKSNKPTSIAIIVGLK